MTFITLNFFGFFIRYYSAAKKTNCLKIVKIVKIVKIAVSRLLLMVTINRILKANAIQVADLLADNLATKGVQGVR